jgi:hypothetical protein
VKRPEYTLAPARVVGHPPLLLEHLTKGLGRAKLVRVVGLVYPTGEAPPLAPGGEIAENARREQEAWG